MTPAAFFASESARLKRDFDGGSYPALIEALMLCVQNSQPLFDWVATLVLQQAEDAFLKGKRGRGRHGNWRAMYSAIQVEQRRAEIVHFHMRARRRRGRHMVSGLGLMFGYGIPAPHLGGVAIVTRDDVFRFASKQLAGTPAQGSAEQMRKAYERSGLSRGAK